MSISFLTVFLSFTTPVLNRGAGPNSVMGDETESAILASVPSPGFCS